MRTPILVSGIALLALVGGAGGYLGGQVLDHQTSAGLAAPLTGGSAQPPSTPTRTPSVPLVRKTPQPNPLPALKIDELDFKNRNFTVSSALAGEVKLSIRVPDGWVLTPSKDKPSEVRFVQPGGERAIRVESALDPDKTVKRAIQDVLTGVQSSQAYQNYVQPLVQNTGQVKDDDGVLRQVGTLVYTYIPGTTTRYVIVRFVATGDDGVATVSMSVTGVPKDKKALEQILAEATASVQIRG